MAGTASAPADCDQAHLSQRHAVVNAGQAALQIKGLRRAHQQNAHICTSPLFQRQQRMACRTAAVRASHDRVPVTQRESTTPEGSAQSRGATPESGATLRTVCSSFHIAQMDECWRDRLSPMRCLVMGLSEW
jgi:hypothetical protein